eukprot:TRINITY_DN778_c0_g1_i10.p1 TRINITY_DN778_c0_g1~~TRINITY_DN778_c0_g1_i10.p1  ORF type:complete len:128 (-),score=20.54 TRINITY_DN778_c0_g1_i10:225-608(-)
MLRSANETGWSNVKGFYSKLLPIVADAAFTSGQWTYATPAACGDNTAWRLLAWRWNYANTSKRLVVVDYSDTGGCGNIVLPDVVGSGDVTVTELLSGAQYTRSAPTLRSTGLTVVLDPWQAQIFQYP